MLRPDSQPVLLQKQLKQAASLASFVMPMMLFQLHQVYMYQTNPSLLPFTSPWWYYRVYIYAHKIHASYNFTYMGSK